MLCIIRGIMYYLNISLSPVSAVAMILSALSVFSIWKVPSGHAVVVGISCVFSALAVTVFGSLTVVIMNVYEPPLR